MPRDLALLAAVARMRAPSAPQLASALLIRTPSALHRRVRALHALGLVRVHALSPNDPNIVTLTRKGAELVETYGITREEIHVARTVIHRDRHAELIGDLRVGMLRASHRRSDVEIDCFLSDWDTRRAVGRMARRAYIPDAIVALRAAGEQIVLAFEIDRGFEPGPEVRKKAEATVALFRSATPLYGFTSWRPVLLASSERRLATLSRHIVDAGGGALWACGLLESRHEPDTARFALARDLVDAGTTPFVLVRRIIPEPPC